MYSPGSPRPPAGCVTCVFTNCPGHLSLREFDLGLAKEEIWKVDRSIRSLLGGYQGYESKGHAGKFMLMFQDTDSAVAFSMQLQRKLLDEQWDQKTLQQPALTEQKDEAGNVYNRGLSVSVGMCTGVPVMFYFSPVCPRHDTWCTFSLPFPTGPLTHHMHAQPVGCFGVRYSFLFSNKDSLRSETLGGRIAVKSWRLELN